MSPKAVAVAGLSAIAIAASGCSGDSDPEAEFRAAFEKEFSEATWYHRITGIEVEDGWLEITTDAAPGSDSGPICGAAYKFATTNEAGHGIDAVRMMDRDGVEMGGCG